MAEDGFAMGYALGQDSGGGGGFGGSWGEGLWAIIILAMLGFGGGRGFGGFGGGGGMDGFAVNNIDSGVRSLANGICDSTYALNNAINGVSSQLANCCCDIRTEIGNVRYDMATNTRDIIDATNAGTRAILDYLCQDKITTLTAENQALKFQASQVAQNQFITQVGSDIVNRLQPVPVPSYTVANPWASYGYHGGYGCGCGCG